MHTEIEYLVASLTFKTYPLEAYRAKGVILNRDGDLLTAAHVEEIADKNRPGFKLGTGLSIPYNSKSNLCNWGIIGTHELLWEHDIAILQTTWRQQFPPINLQIPFDFKYTIGEQITLINMVQLMYQSNHGSIKPLKDYNMETPKAEHLFATDIKACLGSCGSIVFDGNNLIGMTILLFKETVESQTQYAVCTKLTKVAGLLNKYLE